MRQTVAVSNELPAGLYEVIVTQALHTRLVRLDADLVQRHSLRSADAADRIAQLVARQLERALDAVPETDRIATGVEVARRLLDVLGTSLPRTDPGREAPVPPGELLAAIGERRPDGSVRAAERPLIPLLDTTLLTNAPGEPRVGSQILTEIESADSIDVVMAFIRRSGLLPLLAGCVSIVHAVSGCGC
jgi:hypothetical protein